MKFLSEKEALKRLDKTKKSFQSLIQENYEPQAKSCLTCETQGACCLDEHFVNVHISRLEAVAINQKLENFPSEKQLEIKRRVEKTIEKYGLSETENSFAKTYACPLFEKGTGCLIHSVKPVPCIHHACYERLEDLPPDKLQAETEEKINRLNVKTYGRDVIWRPLPVWLSFLKQDAQD